VLIFEDLKNFVAKKILPKVRDAVEFEIILRTCGVKVPT
jgi:hypothetical protein